MIRVRVMIRVRGRVRVRVRVRHGGTWKPTLGSTPQAFASS